MLQLFIFSLFVLSSLYVSVVQVCSAVVSTSGLWNGDLSDFHKGRIMKAHLAGVSVNQLFGVSSRFKTSSVKKNSWRKLKVLVTERRIVSKQQRTTAAKDSKLNFHLEDPVFTKTDHREQSQHSRKSCDCWNLNHRHWC